ncbi:MAG: hypothetical protein HYZ75_08525 [Elusimicrobia bacterium]|nr:hypothetical protein [Elusimicrobiota bacterium]
MPVTPFHFGPGALGTVLFPRRLSFIVFMAANVAIDVETALNILRRQYPLHGFFHSFASVPLVTAAGALLAPPLWRALASLAGGRLAKDLPRSTAALSCLFASVSHVILDAVMHPDAAPFSPWSPANPLLGAVGLGALHLACAASGLAAAVVLKLRRPV